jgi:hypothetical protein
VGGRRDFAGHEPLRLESPAGKVTNEAVHTYAVRRAICLVLLALCALPFGCTGGSRGTGGPTLGGFSLGGSNVECSSYSWIVTVSECVGCPADIVTPVLDLDASPPLATLKVGTASYLALWPINRLPAGCAGPTGRSEGAYRSSNPAVARIEQVGPAVYGQFAVRAAGAGDALLFVESMATPSGSVRAPFAYCPSVYSPCDPVALVLRVVP